MTRHQRGWHTYMSANLHIMRCASLTRHAGAGSSELTTTTTSTTIFCPLCSYKTASQGRAQLSISAVTRLLLLLAGWEPLHPHARGLRRGVFERLLGKGSRVGITSRKGHRHTSQLGPPEVPRVLLPALVPGPRMLAPRRRRRCAPSSSSPSSGGSHCLTALTTRHSRRESERAQDEGVMRAGEAH